MEVVGLDIGGANLKAAHSSGAARLRPFALWKDPGRLAPELKALLDDLPRCDRLAVTMTGELCDCFETKRQGVSAILDAVEAVAGATPVQVWQWAADAEGQTVGRFVDSALARSTPLQTAAANWLALATVAGRFVPRGDAALLDIGSTTTDLIPLRDGRPVPRGRSDTERLACQELVYTGVRRTPVCALLGSEGAAEFFATTQDVYLLLGQLPENAADRDTADGRPATKQAACARLARMLCADQESLSSEEVMQLAELVSQRQRRLIRYALDMVLAEPAATLVTAGSGEFLAPALLDLEPKKPVERIISLRRQFGPEVSQAACAYAVAVLAAASD
jgi:hypothetical protein